MNERDLDYWMRPQVNLPASPQASTVEMSEAQKKRAKLEQEERAKRGFGFSAALLKGWGK